MNPEIRFYLAVFVRRLHYFLAVDRVEDVQYCVLELVLSDHLVEEREGEARPF